MKKITFSFMLFPILAFTNLPSDGLIAFYPFNGNADDASEFQRHGIVEGATPTEDRFENKNSAYYFDGVDDYITLPENILTSKDQVFTITFWFLSEADSGVVIQEYNEGSENTRFSFYMDESCGTAPGSGHDYCSTMFGCYHYNNNCTSDSLIKKVEHSSGKQYKNPEWYFVSLRIDYESDTTVRFLFTTQGHSDKRKCSMLDMGKVIVGRNGGEEDKQVFFKGKVDDIRIYNRVLSDDEVKTLQNDNMTASDISSSEKNLKVFPNPSDRFVELPNLEYEYNIDVYTVSGSKVDVKVNNNTLDFTEVEKGIYIIQLTNQKSKVIKTEKVLIN